MADSTTRAEVVASRKIREDERKKRDAPVKVRSNFEVVDKLKGHNGAVYGVATFNHNVFTCSQDTTLKMWDAQEHSLLCSFDGHMGIVRTCAFSESRQCLISGSLDRSIKIWDIKANKCIETIRHKTMQELCTVLTDGNSFLSGSEDSAIRIWDIRKLGETQCISTLQGHSSSVFALLKTEEHLFSGSRDHTVKVWNAQSYKPQRDLSFHYDSVTSLLWLKGCLVTASRDRAIKYFIDGQDRTPYSIDSASYPNSSHTDYILDLKKTYDESVFVSASKDGIIKVWDSDAIACGGTFKIHNGAVNKLAWMMGDQYLLSASQDRTVNIIRHTQK